MSWTEKDIPDLSGKVAVVTGANSGLGYQTTLALADHGATVVMAVRNPEKGQAAMNFILAATPGAKLELEELDLADLTSIRRFAERARASHETIDLLFNNAGVMAIPKRKTADGFEMQFGTNHLGHFALTGLLLPSLERAGTQNGGSRIVNTSSVMHRFGRMRFDDLMHEKRYSRWTVYGQSKLANLLFTLELDRRLKAASEPIVAAAAHPGYARTNLQHAGPQMDGSRLKSAAMSLMGRLVAQPASRGALPQLYAGTAPAVQGNDYYGPNGLSEMRGYPKKVDRTEQAKSAADAKRLWTVSEELTGIRYLD